MGGGLLLGTSRGWFSFDGSHVSRVKSGVSDRGQHEYRKVQGDLLLSTDSGLLQYDGTELKPVKGDKTDFVYRWDYFSGQFLLASPMGLFRYDNKQTKRVPWEKPIRVRGWHQLTENMLLDTDNGLARYDGKQVIAVEGGERYKDTVIWDEWRDVPGGVLMLGKIDQRLTANFVIPERKRLLLYTAGQVQLVAGEVPETSQNGSRYADRNSCLARLTARSRINACRCTTTTTRNGSLL